MFRSYFLVIFRWYTNSNILRDNSDKWCLNVYITWTWPRNSVETCSGKEQTLFILCNYVDGSVQIIRTGWRTKWSTIWYINKKFISVTILKTNIQKERPFHEDLSSVNQVFNMTTITSGNFFNTDCDDVRYSAAHILLSRCRSEWLMLLFPLLFAALSE
jgi:hypothetical protein